MELAAVTEPGDALAAPVVGSTIPDGSPCVPALVGDVDSGTDTLLFIADTARGNITVHGSVAGQLAVDSLENIDLSARGPDGTLSDRLTQCPESGPDALLVPDLVATEANLGLGQSASASLGSESVPGLDTA